MSAQVREHLQSAIAGLRYESETDEPFEIVGWPDERGVPNAKRLLELTSRDLRTPVEALSLDEFFENLTAEEDWYGDEEKATTAKYRTLESIFRDLRDSQVFRIGEVEIDIYIIGATPGDGWLGVRTKSVET